jgi:hypothetical protein
VDIQLRTVGPGFVEKQLCEAAQLLLVHVSSLGATPETALYRAMEHSGGDVSLAEMDSGPVGT